MSYFCPFLPMVIYNTRNQGNTVVVKSETTNFQQCLEQRCMAYDAETKACKRLSNSKN